MIFFAIVYPWFLLFTVADSMSLTGTNEAVLSFHIGSKPKSPEVHLENFSDMTATVQFYINETSNEKRVETIIVNAPQNYGIMASVKLLHLRTYKLSNSTNRALCKDFLKFKTSIKPQEEYQQICGEVNDNDRSLKPNGLIGTRIFHEPIGRVNLSLNTFYYSVLPSKTNIAEIVFTAFLDCWRSEGQKLKRCSKSDTSSCISNNLSCDGTIHCAFPDGFGTDEGDCAFESDSMSTLEKNEDVELADKSDKSEYQLFNSRYFIPTGLILFMIWGIVTMIRKCYKCYKEDKEKEELYY